MRSPIGPLWAPYKEQNINWIHWPPATELDRRRFHNSFEEEEVGRLNWIFDPRIQLLKLFVLMSSRWADPAVPPRRRVERERTPWGVYSIGRASFTVALHCCCLQRSDKFSATVQSSAGMLLFAPSTRLHHRQLYFMYTSIIWNAIWYPIDWLLASSCTCPMHGFYASAVGYCINSVTGRLKCYCQSVADTTQCT